MNVDILTLFFIMSIALIIQAGSLFTQYKLNRCK